MKSITEERLRDFQEDVKDFIEDDIRTIVVQAVADASETLYERMDYIFDRTKGTIRCNMNSYWFRYLDLGRPAITGKLMAFFADPLTDDPRLNGEWYRTRDDITKLNMPKEEFKAAIASGDLIITQKVKASKPRNFSKRASGEAKNAMHNYIRSRGAVLINQLTADFAKELKGKMKWTR